MGLWQDSKQKVDVEVQEVLSLSLIRWAPVPQPLRVLTAARGPEGWTWLPRELPGLGVPERLPLLWRQPMTG